MKKLRLALILPAIIAIVGIAILNAPIASAKPKGQWVTFSVDKGMDSAYPIVLTEIKKEGYDVDSASKDSGIKTAITIEGGYHQTGTHLEASFISESDTKTTVKVAIFEQKRYKAMKTEPWSDGEINQQKTDDAAGKIKASLGL